MHMREATSWGRVYDDARYLPLEYDYLFQTTNGLLLGVFKLINI